MDCLQNVISDAELCLIKEIRLYKNNINKCKTTLIESNKKMKELVSTITQECESKIKIEIDIYKQEMNKVYDRIEKTNNQIEERGFNSYLEYPDISEKIELEISNKTNQILNEIGIDYEQHVIKSFEKCKEKKYNFEKQIENILDKREKCFDNMMNTYKENIKQMYHDIRNEHEILMENINDKSNDYFYMPRAEAQDQIKECFTNDFKRELNNKVDKILFKSKVLVEKNDDLLRNFESVKSRITGVEQKVDGLYDKCDDITDTFIDKGDIHRKMIKSQTKHFTEVLNNRMKKFETNIDVQINTKMNKRIREINKFNLSTPKDEVKKQIIIKEKIISQLEEFEKIIKPIPQILEGCVVKSNSKKRVGKSQSKSGIIPTPNHISEKMIINIFETLLETFPKYEDNVDDMSSIASSTTTSDYESEEIA